MPDIISINPTGLFSYGLHPTITLDGVGLVHLTGKNLDRITQTANMAGKSSLPNALCHILFGEDPVNASDTEIVNQVWDKGCWGKVVFKHDGALYRVVMARSWSGAYPDPGDETAPYDLHAQGHRIEGTDLYFDIWRDGSWRDIRAASSKETRANIIQAFGMSYRQFLTTSYLAQQTGSLLVTGKNKERMKIVTELCDMEKWDRAVAYARTQLKITEDEMVRLEGHINGLKVSLERINQPLTPDAVSDLEGKIFLYNTAIQDNTAIIAETDKEVTKTKDALDQTWAHARKLQDAANKVRITNSELERKISEINNKYSLAMVRDIVDPADAETVKKIEDKILIAESNYKALNEQLGNAMQDGGICDRCGSVVSEEHIDKHFASIEEKMQELRKLIDVDLKDALEQATQTGLRNSTAKQNELRAKCNEEIRVVQAEINSNNTDILKAASVSKDVNDAITKLQGKIDVLTKKRNTLADENNVNGQLVTQYKEQISQNQSLIEQRHKVEQDIETTKASWNTTQHHQRRLKIVINGMGDKGIKAHKFGAIIATLNDLIAEYINILTDGQVQVWFSPWRERSNAKSSEDVVAEIKIFVKEGPKEEVDLKLYSGAERQQITLAIIHAFWRLATMQHGGTNLLVLDETMDCMDNSTATTAVKLLDHLREAHYGTILVISHSEFIKEQIEYDQTWMVVKHNHMSQIRPLNQAA